MNNIKITKGNPLQIKGGIITLQELEILKANWFLVQQKLFPTALILGLFRSEAHSSTQLYKLV